MSEDKPPTEEGLGRADGILLGLIRAFECRCGEATLRRLVRSQRFPLPLTQASVSACRCIVTASRRQKGPSTREFEAVDLAAQGLRTSAIGSRMGVSELTVEEFIKRARFKLGASSRQELAVRIAALASAAQTPPTSSEDARAFFVEVRSDFDRLLRNLVARVLRALGAQDIGALLAGRTTAVQLADVEHQDCHYILQGMAEATLPTLRCREREITPLLACGLPKEAIALRLGISVLTVKTHAGSIFCKYQVHTWQELAARLMADCAPGLSRTNLPPPPERSTN